MAYKPRRHFFGVTGLVDEAVSECPACQKSRPWDAVFCPWCGVDVVEVGQYLDDHEEASEGFKPLLSETDLRPILARKRTRSDLAGLKTLLAYHALQDGNRDALQLQGLFGLPFVPRDYQVNAATRVLTSMHGRAILADEVGLGKTIEAGLVIRELLVRGRLDSTLLLVPSSLVEQWREELEDKFDMKLATHETHRYWRKPLVLLSLTRSKMPQVARKLKRRKWDLVLVDEAHSLKNERTVAHQFVKSLGADRLMLLTATPIENDLKELYNLLSLVEPTAYPTFRRFSRDFLSSRYKVRNPKELREFCSRFLIRSRRSEVFPEMPKRYPRLVAYEQTDRERRFFERVLTFVRALYARRIVNQRTRDDNPATTMLFVTLLLKESCSSPEAVVQSLENVVLPRTTQEEARHVRVLLREGRKLTRFGKLERLVQELQDLEDSAVVYVEFNASHEVLQKRLKSAGLTVHPYTGKMNAAKKHESLVRFREEGGILLCTEVGGQGLNLQHCHIVVNYDLPWNPMKLEQRIGRVHRFGQERSIEILNFVGRDTYEVHVFDLLARKLDLFTQVVGEVEAILSFMEDDESIQQMVVRAICETSVEAELVKRFDGIERQVQQANKRYEKSTMETHKLLDGV